MNRLSRLCFSILLLCLSLARGQVADSPDAIAYEQETKLFIEKVPEFQFIRTWAEANGIQAWLFGGTAATVGLKVRTRMMARFSSPQKSVEFTEIFHSLQDLDIVIDGGDQIVNKLETALKEKFPHFQPSDISNPEKAKTAWEVRPLKQPLVNHIHPKEALLNNPEFLYRNNDSFSTGLIEITKSEEPLFRDLRDFNNPRSAFFESLRTNTLRFYRSPGHLNTERTRLGLNPEILSAVRYLIKATQFMANLDDRDMREITDIIAQAKALNQQDKYVQKWIERNGKKLVQGAKSLEYSMNLVEESGLLQYLVPKKGPMTYIRDLVSAKKNTDGNTLADWIQNDVFSESKRLEFQDYRTVYYKIKDIKDYERILRSGSLNIFKDDPAGVTMQLSKPEGHWFAEIKLSRQAIAGKDYTESTTGSLKVLNRGAVQVVAKSILPSTEKLLAISEIRVSPLRLPFLLELTRVVNAHEVVAPNDLESLYATLDKKLVAGTTSAAENLVMMSLKTTENYDVLYRRLLKIVPENWVVNTLGLSHLSKLKTLNAMIHLNTIDKMPASDLHGFAVSLKDSNNTFSFDEFLLFFSRLKNNRDFESSRLLVRYGLPRLSESERALMIQKFMESKTFKADEEVYHLIAKYVWPDISSSQLPLLREFIAMAQKYNFNKTLAGLNKYVLSKSDLSLNSLATQTTTSQHNGAPICRQIFHAL